MEVNSSGQKFDLEDKIFVFKRKYRIFIDKIAPMTTKRWGVFLYCLTIFLIRMFWRQGYAVLAYLLGLFYLNSIMLYLAPADDPEDAIGEDKTDFSLPVREQDEYKGF